MLDVPAYIIESNVCGLPISYSWKPDQDVQIRDKYSKNIEKMVQKTSLRASLALGIAVGEWMTWRLNSLSPYGQAQKYVEALWARTLDEHYLKIDHLDPAKDMGDPVIGPLLALEHALYLMLVNTTYDEPDRGKSVSQLASLTRYTLTDPSAFDTWLRSMLNLLTEKFVSNPEDPGGVIVPRVFFDPKTTIDLVQIPQLLDEQLQKINYQGNPFLASPTEMTNAGFEGVPYRYQP